MQILLNKLKNIQNLSFEESKTAFEKIMTGEVSENEIHYSFTVTDNLAYTQSFSGERILVRNTPEKKVYEFACHEGNYSLSGILAGARRLEVERQ